jgi:hypothetical protein
VTAAGDVFLAGELDCVQCFGSGELAAGAATSRVLDNQAVIHSKIGPISVGFNELANRTAVFVDCSGSCLDINASDVCGSPRSVISIACSDIEDLGGLACPGTNDNECYSLDFSEPTNFDLGLFCDDVDGYDVIVCCLEDPFWGARSACQRRSRRTVAAGRMHRCQGHRCFSAAEVPVFVDLEVGPGTGTIDDSERGDGSGEFGAGPAETCRHRSGLRMRGQRSRRCGKNRNDDRCKALLLVWPPGPDRQGERSPEAGQRVSPGPLWQVFELHDRLSFRLTVDGAGDVTRGLPLEDTGRGEAVSMGTPACRILACEDDYDFSDRRILPW